MKMKTVELMAMSRWLVALALVVIGGAASIWFTESISPPKMTGWQRLHVTLPVLTVFGCGLAIKQFYLREFRTKYYFCLASPTACFLLAIAFLRIPGEPFMDFLSIFISLPISMLLIELIFMGKRSIKNGS